MTFYRNYAENVCQASWRNVGDTESLSVEISPGVSITECLGRIKQKKDGRYSWWICWPRTFFSVIRPPTKCEGVAQTAQEARMVVEQFWRQISFRSEGIITEK